MRQELPSAGCGIACLAIVLGEDHNGTVGCMDGQWEIDVFQLLEARIVDKGDQMELL